MNWRKYFDPGAFIMGSGNYEVELTLSSSEEGLLTSILHATQRKVVGEESAFFIKYKAIDRTTLLLGPGNSEPGDIMYVYKVV